MTVSLCFERLWETCSHHHLCCVGMLLILMWLFAWLIFLGVIIAPPANALFGFPVAKTTATEVDSSGQQYLQHHGPQGVFINDTLSCGGDVGFLHLLSVGHRSFLCDGTHKMVGDEGQKQCERCQLQSFKMNTFVWGEMANQKITAAAKEKMFIYPLSGEKHTSQCVWNKFDKCVTHQWCG